MKIFTSHSVRSALVVLSLSVGTFVATAPLQPVLAQARALPDFPELVDQVGPSVVNVQISKKVPVQSQQFSQMDERTLEFLRQFGMIPIVPGNPRQPQRPGKAQPKEEEELRPAGLGSGFILTADGFIMTNAHVVDGADEVLVTLTDKREFPAKVIGMDEPTDIAVLKIEATGLPAVKVGDVSRLRVGEWVLAIGSPFGLESSVTAGIVSAKKRDIGNYLPLIQTDVAVNPGNSGGPLINMRGEVVGINNQIVPRVNRRNPGEGVYMGISFAIPIDEALRVSDQLRSMGHVTRGRIGVQIAPVSKEVAQSIGLEKPAGAMVNNVLAGTPAEKAGVEPGDIITRFDGKAIEKPNDLSRFVGETKPGTKASMTVFRRGSSKDLSITTAELETDTPAATAPTREEKSKPSAASHTIGLSVSDLTGAQRKEHKIKGGVKVDAVADAAARAGLRPGDVILALANTEVTSVKEFEAVLSKQDRTKPLSVLVWRDGLVDFTVIKPAP